MRNFFNLKEVHPKYINYLLIVTGIFIGFKLSVFENFSFFKLLNIVGLSFDIVGVMILSYLLGAGSSFKKVVLKLTAGTVPALITLVPISIFIGALFSLILNETSLPKSNYFGAVLMFTFISAVFLGNTVVNSKKEASVRIKFMGSYFLLSGLIIQLYAAFLDFMS